MVVCVVLSDGNAMYHMNAVVAFQDIPHYSLVLWDDDGALLDLNHFYLRWETVGLLQTKGV